MKPRQNNNWVPPKAWTAFIDTNVFKMLKLKLQGVHARVYEQFRKRALLGEEIADLSLRTLDGRREVNLRDFRGRKYLVLEFGAVT